MIAICPSLPCQSGAEKLSTGYEMNKDSKNFMLKVEAYFVGHPSYRYI